MKKSFLLPALLLVFVFASLSGCKKDEGSGPDQSAMTEVTFQIANKSGGGLKSTADTIHCSPHVASYIKAVIDGTTQKIGAIHGIDGVLSTNTLRLAVGQHSVSEFTTWYDNGTPNNENDDILLSGAPHAGYPFSTYVEHPLELSFSVTKDLKTPVFVEVVCYEEQNAAKFGFAYFGLGEVTVRTFNFFGDFCIKKKSDYIGSSYAQQTNWPNAIGEYYDAPAKAMIEVWRKQDNGPWVKQPKSPTENDFRNSLQGETIKVTVGDYKNRVDSFELKLFVYVRQGTNFDYKYFTSWKFKDDQRPLETTDPNPPYGKTIYYALGSCTPSANYILPAYMNLPPTATYKIVGNYAPGSLGAYVDAELTNVASGYEFGNGLYASNCADYQTTITVGQPYNMDVYSSLYPNLLPLFARTNQWAQINYLINRIGLAGTNDLYPGHTWSDVQGAIWLLKQPTPWNGVALAGVPNVTPMMTQMAADAQANYANYTIPTGGWACVIFIPAGTPPNAPTATVQTMFIKIDP